MTSLPEQLSAARTKGLDAQFQLFRSLATQALDNAGRFVNLNLSASRDTVERSSRAMRQLIGATDPRDLAALRSHAEEQVRSLFNYSRDLLDIAVNAQPQVLRTISASAPAALPAPVPARTFVDAGIDTAQKTAQVVADGAQQATQAVADTARQATQASVAAAERATQAAADTAGQAARVSFDNVADTMTRAAQDSVQMSAQPSVQPSAQPQANAEKNDSAADDPVAALVQEHALKDEPAGVQSVDTQASSADDDDAAGRAKPIARAVAKGAPKAAAAQQPLAAPVSGKASVTSIGATPPKRRK